MAPAFGPLAFHRRGHHSRGAGRALLRISFIIKAVPFLAARHRIFQRAFQFIAIK